MPSLIQEMSLCIISPRSDVTGTTLFEADDDASVSVSTVVVDIVTLVPFPLLPWNKILSDGEGLIELVVDVSVKLLELLEFLELLEWPVP